ncbi:MAG: type II secretion system F family protein [Microgenomates group bacterium]|nr:type II secretion system F family protein [Microgenomates group bacterium]
MYFRYRALKQNKIINGRLDANSETDVIDYLKNNNCLPIEIKKVEAGSGGFLNFIFDRVSFTDIVDLTRQLAIMLNAGLTLIDSFDIIKKQVTKNSLYRIVEDIDKEIRGGNSLSSALMKYPQHFSSLYVSLVKAGESSGKLSDILLKLAENLEKQREFQGKIKGALIYPIIIIIAMVSVMFIMVTFVIPKLLNLYKEFGVTLPLSTQILIVISNFSSKFWPFIILATIGGIFIIRSYLKTHQGKKAWDSFTLKIPIIGPVIKMSTLVDSTRTLSILVGSGVSILDALSIIIETSSNVVYQDSFKNIYKQVEKGVSLGTAMEQEEVFPPILVQMTTVGEQTGHLDDTLLRISRYFEMESELAVKALTTMIEPLILVILGFGVGFLVLSVITPIYNLTSSIK